MVQEQTKRRQKLETFEQALDRAINMLTERFEKPDQNAAVQLANSLLANQERERFEQRGDTDNDVPYRV